MRFVDGVFWKESENKRKYIKKKRGELMPPVEMTIKLRINITGGKSNWCVRNKDKIMTIEVRAIIWGTNGDKNLIS